MQQTEQAHPYWDWQAREGLPIVTGLAVNDLNDIEVGDWPRYGGRGAFVDLGVHRGEDGGGYVCEIAAGGQLNPIHHMFSEAIYITQGRGATTIWLENGPKQMVEWQEGSTIGIPENAWFQHFNTGQTPARFYSLNNFGHVMNHYASDDFIWDNPFQFKARFTAADDFYSADGELLQLANSSYRRVWKTNFIPDAANLELHEWQQRGAGGANVILELAYDVCPHISGFPVGTYKKAHKHGTGDSGGAQLLILSGIGYTMAWPPGGELHKLDWKKNGLVVAPSQYYHQHFNAGATEARYLACIGLGTNRTRRSSDVRVTSDVSEEEGGIQVEYNRENPEIHRIFEDELKKHGAECHMAGFSPFCTVG